MQHAVVNCGCWCHQCARCVNENRASVLCRVSLPTPQDVLKNGVLCAVLLLGSLGFSGPAFFPCIPLETSTAAQNHPDDEGSQPASLQTWNSPMLGILLFYEIYSKMPNWVEKCCKNEVKIQNYFPWKTAVWTLLFVFFWFNPWLGTVLVLYQLEFSGGLIPCGYCPSWIL